MRYLRSSGPVHSPKLFHSIQKTVQFTNFLPATFFSIILLAIGCMAQQDPQAADAQSSRPLAADNRPDTITIPAGTSIALVLTQPIQSRSVRRGDGMYAQIISPVDSGTEMVIPPGTFVQGVIEKVGRESARGELRLTSMSITFPDGYVAPISGPIMLRTDEGYAIKDPGTRRGVAALALPAAGAGLGALIGHSVGTADSTTTSAFPPGCVGVPPFCSTTSMPVFGTKTKDAIIGAGIGGIIGGVASVALLFSSHQFYLDAGAPIQMTLQQPVTLKENEVAKAVRQSEEHPVPPPPVEARPLPPPPSDTSVDHGTCYTPGTPGTPPTVVPGAPGPDGVPGPPTVIPGTPPTPGTPYPCP